MPPELARQGPLKQDAFPSPLHNRYVAAWLGYALGWAFLVTLMPTFLKQAKGLGDVATGSMSSVALLVGMVGMLGGGCMTPARLWGSVAI